MQRNQPDGWNRAALSTTRAAWGELNQVPARSKIRPQHDRNAPTDIRSADEGGQIFHIYLFLRPDSPITILIYNYVRKTFAHSLNSHTERRSQTLYSFSSTHYIISPSLESSTSWPVHLSCRSFDDYQVKVTAQARYLSVDARTLGRAPVLSIPDNIAALNLAALHQRRSSSCQTKRRVRLHYITRYLQIRAYALPRLFHY